MKILVFWPHFLNLFKNVVLNLKSHPILNLKSFLKTSAYTRLYTVLAFFIILLLWSKIGGQSNNNKTSSKWLYKPISFQTEVCDETYTKSCSISFHQDNSLINVTICTNTAAKTCDKVTILYPRHGHNLLKVLTLI